MKELLESIVKHLPYKVLEERDSKDPYLVRYRLFSLGPIKVYLHRILREDSTQDFHDHPWPFLQVILYGGYVEEIPQWAADWRSLTRKSYLRKPGTIKLRKPEFIHRVGTLTKEESWSLVIRGEKTREWGFIDAVTGQYTHWEDYINRMKGREDASWRTQSM